MKKKPEAPSTPKPTPVKPDATHVTLLGRLVRRQQKAEDRGRYEEVNTTDLYVGTDFFQGMFETFGSLAANPEVLKGFAEAAKSAGEHVSSAVSRSRKSH